MADLITRLALKATAVLCSPALGADWKNPMAGCRVDQNNLLGILNKLYHAHLLHRNGFSHIRPAANTAAVREVSGSSPSTRHCTGASVYSSVGNGGTRYEKSGRRCPLRAPVGRAGDSCAGRPTGRGCRAGNKWRPGVLLAVRSSAMSSRDGQADVISREICMQPGRQINRSMPASGGFRSGTLPAFFRRIASAARWRLHRWRSLPGRIRWTRHTEITKVIFL